MLTLAMAMLGEGVNDGLGTLPDRASRCSHSDGPVRHIPEHARPRADNSTLADGHTRCDEDICSQPRVIANDNRGSNQGHIGRVRIVGCGT